MGWMGWMGWMEWDGMNGMDGMDGMDGHAREREQDETKQKRGHGQIVDRPCRVVRFQSVCVRIYDRAFASPGMLYLFLVFFPHICPIIQLLIHKFKYKP